MSIHIKHLPHGKSLQKMCSVKTWLNSGHQRTFGITINLNCNNECNVVLNWNILYHKFQCIRSIQTLDTFSTTGNTVLSEHIIFDGEAEVRIV